jgi:hypothetical protein
VQVIAGADEKTCDILRLALMKKDEK